MCICKKTHTYLYTHIYIYIYTHVLECLYSHPEVAECFFAHLEFPFFLNLQVVLLHGRGDTGQNLLGLARS